MRRGSLRTKLVGLAMVASVAALVLETSAFLWADRRDAAIDVRREAVAAADILALNAASAVLFDDAESAERTLAALGTHEHVIGAAIYRADGQLFATYGTWNETRPPDPGRSAASNVLVERPITAKGKAVGSLFLRQSLAEVGERTRARAGLAAIVLVLATMLAFATSLWMQGRVTGPLLALAAVARRVSAEQDYAVRAERTTNDEIGELTDAFNGMLDVIDTHARDLEQRVAVRTAELSANAVRLGETNRRLEDEYERQRDRARLSVAMQGVSGAEELATAVLQTLAHILGAEVGALYLREPGEDALERVGLLAVVGDSLPDARIRLGSGQVGEAARDGVIRRVQGLPGSYLTVSSSLGEARPVELVVVPFALDGEVVGVLELAALAPFGPGAEGFLDDVAESLAVVFSAALDRGRAARLLQETRRQALALEQQQEELRATNETLAARTGALERSEREMQAQQEELRAANEELESQTQALASDRRELRAKNIELERLSGELEEKAERLAETSRYKSEFLANMSHELRTPLNSVLILSHLLAENREETLTEKQTEFARTIEKSGNDLLRLIDEVLDLAKVEAGRMELTVETVRITGLVESMRRGFEEIARRDGLEFRMEIDPRAPETLRTDSKRLEQILRNLLSNAFKFTEDGAVTLAVKARGQDVVFAVTDTGPGIPEDRQVAVWEAFQQVDGTTSRRYGGTGLGLSIVRELSTLLGGEASLVSTPGEGSTFSVWIPIEGPSSSVSTSAEELAARLPRMPSAPPEPADAELLQRTPVPDDRLTARPGEPTLLVIDDDDAFAAQVMALARARGFRCVVAGDGHSGLAMAQHLNPIGVVLDVGLPDVDGWAVFDALRRDERTASVPIHFVSSGEDRGAVRLGARGFLRKPASRDALVALLADLAAEGSPQRVLLVEDDATLQAQISELLSNENVRVEAVGEARAASELLRTDRYDCLVVDLGLPDTSGAELLRMLRDAADSRVPPIVVYTGRELTDEEATLTQALSDSVIIKGARSPERLLDEVRLFLHSVHSGGGQADAIAGRTVLLVDDDMRNVYALTEVIENAGAIVVAAEDGRAALDLLAANPEIDLVLMDMMMPEMDGYEATRAIRKTPALRKVPVIALTARAMKGDRERCLEAGCNDYLPKPVDLDRLLSTMRVWLSGGG